jgi:hypothetical protein
MDSFVISYQADAGSATPASIPADAHASLPTLVQRWNVCVIVLAALGIAVASADSSQDFLTDALSTCLLALCLGLCISCVRLQVEAINELCARGFRAEPWYVLLAIGAVLLIPGIVVESGMFLLYTRHVLRRRSELRASTASSCQDSTANEAIDTAAGGGRWQV